MHVLVALKVIIIYIKKAQNRIFVRIWKVFPSYLSRIYVYFSHILAFAFAG